MARVLKIYQHTDPILRTKCRNIIHIEGWVLELADDMWMTMLTSKAVGLAANQVGMDYRMITISGEQFQGPMINPTIEEKSKEVYHFGEACLSVPGYQFDTGKRNKHITVSYFDLTGKRQTTQVSDMTSVIIQHEMDHLNGVVFTDYLDGRLRGK